MSVCVCVCSSRDNTFNAETSAEACNKFSFAISSTIFSILGSINASCLASLVVEKRHTCWEVNRVVKVPLMNDIVVLVRHVFLDDILKRSLITPIYCLTSVELPDETGAGVGAFFAFQFGEFILQ